MSQADVIRLVDTARPHLPGAVDAAIMLELFGVMKEFFIETNAWGDEISFGVNTEDSEYTIVPANGSIVRLFSVVNEDDEPVAATMPMPGVIRIFDQPSAEATYYAKVSLTVADPTNANDQPQMPLWAFSRYFPVLLDGLLGRMMSQPAKPYSSPQTALVRLRRFNSGMARARVEITREFSHNAARWRFPRFGA